MPEPGGTPEPGRTSQRDRDETPSEHADRNFSELVQELRVAQTGVQILFAFLLTLAFYESFPRDSGRFAAVLTAALLTAAAAALFFMAPVAAHRLNFRTGQKERLVRLTHVMARAGMALLAIAMILALWIVLAFLWSQAAATAASLGVLVLVLCLWVLVPVLMRADR